MKHNNPKRSPFPFWQYGIGSFILVSVLVFSFLTVLQLSIEPRLSDKEKSSQIAKQYADLQTVETFAYYNAKESYYSLIGQDSQGRQLAVLVGRGRDQVRAFELDQGISQAEAESLAQENGAGQIDKTTFGYLDGQPVWEIKSGKSYYNIGFESRELLSKEGL